MIGSRWSERSPILIVAQEGCSPLVRCWRGMSSVGLRRRGDIAFFPARRRWMDAKRSLASYIGPTARVLRLGTNDR